MEGKKFDKGKPRMSLMIMNKALREVAKVATFGSDKYGDHNFRNGMDWSRLADADLRHLFEFLDGNRIDEESKLSHLAHHAWNALALLEFELNKIGNDDLFKGYDKKNDTIPVSIPKGARAIGVHRDFHDLRDLIPDHVNLMNALVKKHDNE